MDNPENILRDIIELKKVMDRAAIRQSEMHPALLSRMQSVCPPSLRVDQAAKITSSGPSWFPTHICFLITTRDDRRSTYLSIPISVWMLRMATVGDGCKAVIREAKRTLYKRHRGTWAERTLGRDTWAPMTEGGW